MSQATARDPESLRIELAERIARAFNREGVAYAVLSGLYGYPEIIGRDLDIAINTADVPRALRLIDEVVDRTVWPYMFSRYAHYGVWQVYIAGFESCRLRWIEIDLLCKDRSLLLGVVPYASIKDILSSRIDHKGPFAVSPFGFYFKTFFRPIYYAHLERFRTKYRFEPPEADVREQLESIVGRKALCTYLAIAENLENPGAVARLHAWKWKLNIRFTLTHPFQAVRNLFVIRVLRPLGLYLFNSGIVVAVVGPDGVGKSSTLAALKSYLNGFLDIRGRHWRPRLLPEPGWFLGRREVDEGSSRPPCRKRGNLVEHWMRIAYYWLDYMVGYFAKDRFLHHSVIQLALYDRHAIDTAVDPVRYRLRSASGTRLLYQLTPRPDRIIRLTDSVDRIYARKQELSPEEIARQLALWKQVRKDGQVDSSVTVRDSPEDTARILATEILKAMERRFSVARSRI